MVLLEVFTYTLVGVTIVAGLFQLILAFVEDVFGK